MCLDDSPYFRMIELDEIDSTNNFLKGYRPLTPVDVTLVTAEHQSAGRGQAGNSWESERSQNLLFSLLLTACPVPSSQLFAISEAIALAIREAMIHHSLLLPSGRLGSLELPLNVAAAPQRGANSHLRRRESGGGLINHPSSPRGGWEGAFTVKWPNDIYVGDSKIAGILIENDLQGASVSRSIIGCGVNINQASFHFPTLAPTAIDGEKHAPTPVSLFQLLGHTTERRFVLESIMDHFMHHYADLQRGAFDKIHAAYRAALYRGTGLHPFRDADGPFTASIEGVEPTGHLLLRDTDHRLRRYAFKEVSFC